MKKLTLTTAALFAAFLAPPALASEETDSSEGIVLTGMLRDFQQSHPDMQNPNKSFGVKTGLVASELDNDGKPVLYPSSDPSRGMISGSDSFAQWFRDTPGVNQSFAHAITLTEHPTKKGVYYFAKEKQLEGDDKYFFPMDDHGGFNDMQTTSVGTHNYYFTYELLTEFTYTDPASRDQEMTFKFVGDDDVWVFINGQLAVDIGGVHGQATGQINVDDAAAGLGLEIGENYELVLFFAERHTTQSNFRLETTLQLYEVPPTTTSPLYD